MGGVLETETATTATRKARYKCGNASTSDLPRATPKTSDVLRDGAIRSEVGINRVNVGSGSRIDIDRRASGVSCIS